MAKPKPEPEPQQISPNVAIAGADPPAAKPSYEELETSVATLTADLVLARAERDAHSKPDVVAVADDHPDNPARCYLPREIAAYEAGVDPKTAWHWWKTGQVYGFKIAGTARIMLCKNDLINRRLRVGRHGKPP
jgi:hypothetical protein